MATKLNEGPQSVQFQLDPEDIVLCILEAHERLFGRKQFSGITRLEKLIFLLQHETDFQGVIDLFNFRAYNFGPFSKEVYEAIDFLTGVDLVTVSERTYPSIYVTREEKELATELSDLVDADTTEEDGTAGASEKIFELTGNGREIARRLRNAFATTRPQDVEDLDGIVQRYGRLPLGQLIRYVYRRYPDMTVNSIHPEAQRRQLEKA